MCHWRSQLRAWWITNSHEWLIIFHRHCARIKRNSSIFPVWKAFRDRSKMSFSLRLVYETRFLLYFTLGQPSALNIIRTRYLTANKSELCKTCRLHFVYINIKYFRMISSWIVNICIYSRNDAYQTTTFLRFPFWLCFWCGKTATNSSFDCAWKDLQLSFCTWNVYNLCPQNSR